MSTNGELKTIHVRLPEWDEARMRTAEARYPSLKRLNEACEDKTFGDVLLRSDAIAICGSEKEFKRISAKWRGCMLLAHKATVEYRHKVKGYLFVPADEMLRARFQKKQAAQERQAAREWLALAMLPTEQLGDHEQRLRVFELDSYARQRSAASNLREQHLIGCKRPETLPRLPNN